MLEYINIGDDIVHKFNHYRKLDHKESNDEIARALILELQNFHSVYLAYKAAESELKLDKTIT